MGGTGSRGARADVREALPLDRRATLAVGVLVVVIIIDLLAVLADLGQLSAANRLIGGERVPFAELDSVDNHVVQTGLMQTVSLVVAVITFLLWYSRAYRNVIAMGIRAPRYGTRWAVWYWFIPIVLLFRPKQVVNDIYRGSDPAMPYGDPGFASRPISGLLNWWWAGWIASGILDRAAGSSAIEANTSSEFATQAKIFIASDLFDAVVAILAILVIRKITARHEERRRLFEAGTLANQGTLQASAAAPPPPPPPPPSPPE